MEKSAESQKTIELKDHDIPEEIYVFILQKLDFIDKVSFAMTSKALRSLIKGRLLKAEDFTFSINASNAKEYIELFTKLEKLKARDRWQNFHDKGFFEGFKDLAYRDLFEFQPYLLSSITFTVNGPKEAKEVLAYFSSIIREKYCAPTFLSRCIKISYKGDNEMPFHSFFRALLTCQSELKTLVLEDRSFKKIESNSMQYLRGFSKLSSCTLGGFTMTIPVFNALSSSASLKELNLVDITFNSLYEPFLYPEYLESLIIEGCNIPAEAVSGALKLAKLQFLDINCTYRAHGSPRYPDISECYSVLKNKVKLLKISGIFYIASSENLPVIYK